MIIYKPSKIEKVTLNSVPPPDSQVSENIRYYDILNLCTVINELILIINSIEDRICFLEKHKNMSNKNEQKMSEL